MFLLSEENASTVFRKTVVLGEVLLSGRVCECNVPAWEIRHAINWEWLYPLPAFWYVVSRVLHLSRTHSHYPVHKRSSFRCFITISNRCIALISEPCLCLYTCQNLSPTHLMILPMVLCSDIVGDLTKKHTNYKCSCSTLFSLACGHKEVLITRDVQWPNTNQLETFEEYFPMLTQIRWPH